MKKINIKGVIVPDSQAWIYEWLEIPHTSPSGVNRAIEKANGEDLEIIINSPGGSVYSGSEIYTALKDYKGKTTGKIVGIAASAAGLIAMGIDNLLISPTAQFMLHNAWNRSEGNFRDHQKNSEFLRNTDKTLANAYMIKTGLKKEELLKLMDEETFLTPEQAMEKGFVDGIMFEEEMDAVASIDNAMMLPQSVIDKISNEFLKKKQQEEDESNNKTEELEIAKAKLQLQILM